jgi:hypothetical protein
MNSDSKENVVMDVDNTQPSPQPTSNDTPVSLTDIEVKDENIALNLFVSFLNLAQRRGAFNMQESAKIWECVTKFQPKQ